LLESFLQGSFAFTLIAAVTKRRYLPNHRFLHIAPVCIQLSASGFEEGEAPIIGQEKSVPLEKSRDILKRQRLLQRVVIEENVCGDDQIKSRCRRSVEPFENDIQIDRFAG